MTTTLEAALTDIPECVARALQEDIGAGDITAMLIPEQQHAKAEVICRQQAVICGCAWVDEVFAQLTVFLCIIVLDDSFETHFKNRI